MTSTNPNEVPTETALAIAADKLSSNATVPELAERWGIPRKVIKANIRPWREALYEQVAADILDEGMAASAAARRWNIEFDAIRKQVLRCISDRRYQELLDQAHDDADTFSTDPELARAHSQFDIWPFKQWLLDREPVEAIRAKIGDWHEFGNPIQRADWWGGSAHAKSPYVLAADPSEDLLRSVHELILASHLAELIRASVSYSFKILACRPRLSIPFTAEDREKQLESEQGLPHFAWHNDSKHPGIRRAILYLTDVDDESGPFQLLDQSGKPTLATGEAGTFLLFNAGVIRHRRAMPLSRSREVLDLVIIPRIEGEEASVSWYGGNSYPVNPFRFSFEGGVAYPHPPAGAVMA